MQLFQNECGEILRPTTVLNDRKSGGHLIVNPPRSVWERSELTPEELASWSFLVAATGEAMLESLPQLEGGCINYWEAGNWSLHHDAEPRGEKWPRESRRVHLHLFGRSRNSSDGDWAWGESPFFPPFKDRLEWAARHEPLNESECAAIVERVKAILTTKYRR
jgi:diadenosine tetraphosphate (Ap4A) HIT family hydrolase